MRMYEVKYHDGKDWVVGALCPTMEAAFEQLTELRHLTGMPTTVNLGRVYNSDLTDEEIRNYEIRRLSEKAKTEVKE